MARALEVNQLWAGHPGRLVAASNETFWALAGKHANDECENGEVDKCINTTLPLWQLWAKPLPDPYLGFQAALLINLGPRTLNISFPFSALGHEGAEVDVIDVWSGSKRRMDCDASLALRSHDSHFLLVDVGLPKP